jgi:RNA polymerase sigma-70 factor (ECF subfamily)
VINRERDYHDKDEMEDGALLSLPDAARTQDRARSDARLRELFDAHYEFVWRSARRLGMSADKADDVAQQVFIVATRKLGAIEAGKERAFLFATAVRTVSDVRRSAPHRREVPGDVPEPTGSVTVEELVDQRRARAMLDEVLDEMPLDLRTVFVLYELEELTTAEIAGLLEIPSGTVASRLRRAREAFTAELATRKARARGGEA